MEGTLTWTILVVLVAPYTQWCIYQIAKYKSNWFTLGLFHLLTFLYFPSFVIAFGFILYIIFKTYTNPNTSPIFMNIKQTTVLAFLNVSQVILEYLALTLSTN